MLVHPMKPDAADETIITLTDENIAREVQRHAAPLFDVELVGYIEVLPIAAVNESIAPTPLINKCRVLPPSHTTFRPIAQHQQMATRRH